MNKEIFEQDENGDVIYNRRFLWFSKRYIVNDIDKQKKLIKLLEAKNILFEMGWSNQPAGMPIIFIFIIFGIPLFFGIKYLFPALSNEICVGITIIMISAIFIWDYYYQIDKILDDK